MSHLVLALHKNGQLNSTTLEAITAATQMGGSVIVAVLSDNPDPIAAEIAKRYSGVVVTVSNPALAACNEEIYTQVLTELIAAKQVKTVTAPATLYGKAVMSRLAAVLKSPMISDITSVRMDGDSVIGSRPGFGGGVISEVKAKTGGGPVCLTIRPKIFTPSSGSGASTETFAPSAAAFNAKSKVNEVRVESSGRVTLADADRVVSAGRGIKGPENVPMVESLAKSVGAAFGASRAVVDAGWVPYASQVGQTGRTVNPKLYIAVGVSGAIQHLVGMQSSQTIVAINKDKDAPIFKVATYGIVGDLFEIVPALTKKFEAELA